MLDVLSILQRSLGFPVDLRTKSIFLASELMGLCGIKDARNKAREILDSGKAYEKFKEIINAQNKSKDFDKKIKDLPLAKISQTINATKTGKITNIDNKKINALCRILGTPETVSSGVYLHKHIGKIKKGEPIITLYTKSKSKMDDALKFIKESKPIIIK
jgi:AMP phosphorylase